VTPAPAVGMPAYLNMVVLSARNLPVLRRFYRDLGWTEQSGSTDALAFFPLGEITLALFPHHAESEESTGGDRSGMTLVVKVATAAGVDTAFADAIKAGGQSISEPADQSFGGRSAVVADPEGNRWELLWTPGANPEG
jgi:predicted lactoylglutathione lyase